jgi:Family of unknown function (DUF5995)
VITTIDDVIERMREIQASLDPDDGVGQFNWVYLRVSEEVRRRLSDGFFRDPRFVEHFDVTFAQRYFAAVDAAAAGQRIDPAWRPLFERRADPRVQPIQFVVAGMNAHINHDIPIAMVDTCLAHGTHPRAPGIRDDYRRVNDVIEDMEAPIRRQLLDDLQRRLDEPVEPVVHLVTSWTIAQAREAAWIRTLVLWLLRDDPWLFEQSIEASARTTGMTGRHLLTPLLGVSHDARPAVVSR